MEMSPSARVSMPAPVQPVRAPVQGVQPVDQPQAAPTTDQSLAGPVKTDSAAIRTMLEARIDDDVASGVVTTEGAASIRKSMDGVVPDEAAASDADADADAADADVLSVRSAPANAPGSGSGGGSGGIGRTEVSRDVVVAGTTKVTTIGYSDGSSESLTEIASDSDLVKQVAPSPPKPTGPEAADYQPAIAKGSLVSVLA